MERKYHIEKNTVQETLVIPLIGRMICAEHYPQLLADPNALRICSSLDYDSESARKRMGSFVGLYGALEVAQRHYDLMWEVKDYLTKHPKASVVNMGCGLDDTFSKVDNGTCRGYNIDMPDVIAIREDLLPAGGREENIACDLNDSSWMDRIDFSDGAVFYAAGVFYYFRTEDLKTMLSTMAKRFPGAVVVFDACNRSAAKMMMKTWLKNAGITDVGAYFSMENVSEVLAWSEDFKSATVRSYMRGYRDIYKDVRPLYRLMINLCDKRFYMNIVRIEFKGNKD